jgi:hypothetical protein
MRSGALRGAGEPPGCPSPFPPRRVTGPVPPSSRPLPRVWGWARAGRTGPLRGWHAAGSPGLVLGAPAGGDRGLWGSPRPPALDQRAAGRAPGCSTAGPRVLPCPVGVARPSPAGPPTGACWASPGSPRVTLTGCGYPAFADPVPGRLTAGASQGWGWVTQTRRCYPAAAEPVLAATGRASVTLTCQGYPDLPRLP